MRTALPGKRFVFAFSLAANVLSAQSPFAVAPESYHLDFENEYVRIVRVTLGPHERVPAHDHPSLPTLYVYTQNAGPIRFSHTGDIVLERPAVHQGQMRFSSGRAETHSVENLSDQPNSYLRVELKTETAVLRLHNARIGPRDMLENSMVSVTRHPITVPGHPSVDVDYATGRGVFRKPGEVAPEPDLRIELKTGPAEPSRVERAENYL